MPEYMDFQDNTGALMPFRQEVYPSNPPISKSVSNFPATATKATISVAGRTGYRHVCTAISAIIAAGATAQTPVGVTLFDGASGAANVLFQGVLSAPANQTGSIILTGLFIPGSQGSAMTLEFSGAGVVASQEAVTLSYTDLKDA